MMLKFKKFLPIFSFLRRSERRRVFEEGLIRLTLSFRAKARNLVSAPPSRISFSRFSAQNSGNHFVRNDLVTQASSTRYFVLKSDCPIRNFVHLLERPFSLWEKARMRGNVFMRLAPLTLSLVNEVPFTRERGFLNSSLNNFF